MELDGKRVLVIGGNGMIGSQICHELGFNGCDIVVASKSLVKWQLFSQIKLDFLNHKSVRSVIRDVQPDILIQSAWYTHPQDYRSNSLNFDFARATYFSAITALELNASYFVGIGSAAELTLLHNQLGTTPTAGTLNSYNFSKLAAANSIKSVLEVANTKFLWVRPFQVFGRREHPDRLIPSLIASLLRDAPFHVQNPSQNLDWISSFDVAKALVWALEQDLEGVIEVGSGQLLTVAEICGVLAKILNCSLTKISFSPMSVASPGYRAADLNNSLFKSGWSPQCSVSQGLKWMIEDL